MTKLEKGYSPDGGQYEIVDGIYYWHDGEVFAEKSTQIIRRVPNANPDLSQFVFYHWTQEHREKLQQEVKEKRARFVEEEESYKKEILALVEVARAKLTEEEFEAITVMQHCETRGFWY